MTDRDVRRLMTKLRLTEAAEFSITPKRPPAKVVADITVRGSMTSKVCGEIRASGSMTGKVIVEGELAQLAEGGHYMNVAASLLEHHTLKTTRRTIVRTEDVAIFLVCLKFFSGRMNADGTLPVKRFEAALDGDVRGWGCREGVRLSPVQGRSGTIFPAWGCWTGRRERSWHRGMDGFGNRKKGRACKWMAGEGLMAMLAWEKSVEVGGVTQVEDEQDERREGEGEEETSLVGTQPSNPSPPAFMTLNEVIRSLTRVAEGEEIRPIEQIEDGRRALSFPTPEQLTLLVLSYEDSIGRLAA